VWVFDRNDREVNYKDSTTQVRFYFYVLDGQEYVVAKRFALDGGFRVAVIKHHLSSQF
jgi:predicted nucleic acid-binding Zn finger protein